MADRGNRGNTFVWEGDYTPKKVCNGSLYLERFIRKKVVHKQAVYDYHHSYFCTW